MSVVHHLHAERAEFIISFYRTSLSRIIFLIGFAGLFFITCLYWMLKMGVQLRDTGLWCQIFAGISASMGSFAFGTLFGWITPILPHLLSSESEIPMTHEEASWMISCPEITTMMTPIPAGILADRIGRKPLILASAPLYTVGWCIIVYYKTYLSLIVARCIQGAAVGIVFAVVPVYLGEIASTECRGAITSLFFIASWMGYLFEYCTGPFLSFTNFTLLTLATSVLYFLLVWVQPESPYYWLMKGNEQDAYKSLKWFRSSSDDQKVVEELERMKLSVTEDMSKKITWKDVIATPTDRKAIFLMLFAGSLRSLSGIQPITAYATESFKESSDLIIAPKYITMILGFVMVFGAFFSFFTLDVLGRRSLIIISSLGCSISLFTAGIFYYLESKTTVDVSSCSWIAPASILVYSAIDVGGLYPVQTAYSSELFTSKTRSTASSIAAVLTTFCILITLKTYQTFIDMFGVYFNFFLYGTICLVGTAVSYLYMPETKNKTFEQIRQEICSPIKSKPDPNSLC